MLSRSIVANHYQYGIRMTGRLTRGEKVHWATRKTIQTNVAGFSGIADTGLVDVYLT
jgi:hypothetical protein